MLSEVVSLIKKYYQQRGFAKKVASHGNTTIHTVYRLIKEGAHLQPGVQDTDIVLEFVKWARRSPTSHKSVIIPIVIEMRQRFHDAPVAERSGLLSQFAVEYDRSSVWVRKVLNHTFYPDATPEIPVPDNFGIGRRIHKTKIKPSNSNE